MNQQHDSWNEYVEKTHNIPSASGLPSHNPYQQGYQQNYSGNNNDNGNNSGNNSGKNTGISVPLWIAVALLVCLLATGALIYFVSNGSTTPEQQTAQPTTTSGIPTSSSTSSESSQETTTETTTETSTATSEPSTSSSTSRPPSEENLPANLTKHGWVGTPGATCNANDEWVFAGQGSGNKVAICRVGQAGGLYYRGHVNGGDWERDVDMNASNVAGQYFEIPSSPDLIIVTGAGIKVERSGEIILDAPFTETYS